MEEVYVGDDSSVNRSIYRTDTKRKMLALVYTMRKMDMLDPPKQIFDFDRFEAFAGEHVRKHHA